MKNVLSIIITLFFITINAQTVTTLTPQFNGSGGLSLDEQGNLFIGDFGDFLFAGDGRLHKVWKLDTDQNMTEFSNGFGGATGNAFDNNGVFYQNDLGGSVFKFVDGVKTLVTNTGLASPIGIVFDSQNNFYVCNCNGANIRKVTPSGVSTVFTSGQFLQCPNGITIDEDDNLYVSDFSNGNVIKITPSGVQTRLLTTPGGTTSGSSNGHLDYFEPTRTLYIASMGSNKIYKLNLDNPTVLTPIAGSGIRGNVDNANALQAQFSRPNGVAITKTGDSIYINSAIPLTNTPNGPLNPQVIRLIKGLNSDTASTETITLPYINLKTYPNPVKDNFTIEVEFTKIHSNLSIKIYSILGKEVRAFSNLKSESLQFKTTLSLLSLSTGTYFYTVFDNNKKFINGKFIKK